MNDDIMSSIRSFIIVLNIFEKVHRTVVSASELAVQRQSTRVYLIFLFMTLFILVLYNSLTYQHNIKSIGIASLADFERILYVHGPNNVECPCTQLSFARQTFHRVEPRFHSVCSSDFIRFDWLNHLFISYTSRDIWKTNSSAFVSTAFAHFQTLRIICDLTRQAVLDARDLFLSTQVVSAFMLDYLLFNETMHAASASFQLTLPNNFMHSLQMLLGMAQGNGLVSAYSTNWALLLPNLTKDATIYTKARIYGTCNCATSPACTQSTIPHVPGIVIGCLPLENFLRSTFECLYNQSCIDMMSIYVNASTSPRALNTRDTRFDSSIHSKYIVERMLIESWSINTSYDKFFGQCRPVTCSYTIIERYNIVYVITTIVSLYGGLTVLLKLIIPIVVYQMNRFMRRYRRRHVQVAPEIIRY
jgi:hypothetical protein